MTAEIEKRASSAFHDGKEGRRMEMDSRISNSLPKNPRNWTEQRSFGRSGRNLRRGAYHRSRHRHCLELGRVRPEANDQCGLGIGRSVAHPHGWHGFPASSTKDMTCFAVFDALSERSGYDHHKRGGCTSNRRFGTGPTLISFSAIRVSQFTIVMLFAPAFAE